MSTNLAIVKKWYTDLDQDLLSDDCEWRIAEGFPAGGTYQGKHAIFEDFFPRLVAHFSQWGVVADEYFDAGDTVVTLGRYQGVVKSSGESVDIPFAHIWHVNGKQITQLKQYADTALLARALSPESHPF